MSEHDTFEADRLDETEQELLAEDGVLSDDGDGLPDEVRAELAALDALEAESATDAERALAEVQAELDAQRAATRSAVSRYREALLTAEPDLPPDLVAGDTLEALEASVAVARETVARIRARLTSAAPAASGMGRGFPVGAPARGGTSRSALSSAEKIAAGLASAGARR